MFHQLTFSLTVSLITATVLELNNVPLANAIVAALMVFGLSVMILLYPVQAYRLSYKQLRGPPSQSLVWGNLRPMLESCHPTPFLQDWIAKYGPTGRYHTLFGSSRLYTIDPAALGYMFRNAYEFPKAPKSSNAFIRLIGDGLVSAEGNAHRNQRRLLTPAFSQAASNSMLPTFYDKVHLLVDKWNGYVEAGTSPGMPASEKPVSGQAPINVLRGCEQLTTDIIGVTGFDTELGSIEEKYHAFEEARKGMILSNHGHPLVAEVQDTYAEFFDRLPTASKRQSQFFLDTVSKMGYAIVNEKKRVIAASFDHVEKSTEVGNDLLSRLIKANMAPDLPDNQRLSDKEVMDQITTFMLAGNATIAVALTWCLYRLACNPDIQTKLRKELETIDQDEPSMDTLNKLDYLDKVTREVLRFDSPLPISLFMAGVDVVLPLSMPVEGRDGKLIDHVKLRKGDEIMIPIQAVNRSKAIWGDDADKFNPDRFGPSVSVPGVYPNLMTFLGGPRGCIGWRFAIAEFKAVIFTLIRAFEFEQLPSKPEISKKTVLVTRTCVVGQEASGMQMPLIVRPVSKRE